MRKDLLTLLFFVINCLLVTLGVCSVGLGFACGNMLTLLLLIPFLWIQIMPNPGNRRIANGRLRVCADGSELLIIFLIASCLSGGAYLFWLLRYGYSLPWLIGGIAAFILLAGTFWNGIIRVYVTSVQLGVKQRIIGALCGLAGYMIGAGLDQTVTTESAGGQGFTGIMVAWLGKFNPLAMILTSALIQLLNQGAAQISQDFDVSGAFPNVIVGIILFFIIGSEFFINYEIHFRGHHSHAEAGKEAVK